MCSSGNGKEYGRRSSGIINTRCSEKEKKIINNFFGRNDCRVVFEQKEVTFSRFSLLKFLFSNHGFSITVTYGYMQQELKTLEWWILGLMLDPLFFLISRLT